MTENDIRVYATFIREYASAATIERLKAEGKLDKNGTIVKKEFRNA